MDTATNVARMERQRLYVPEKPEITKGELYDALTDFDLLIHRTSKWKKGDLIDQARDYIESGTRDDLDEGIIFLSLQDRHEAGIKLADIAEKHLRKFVIENFDSVQRICGLGKYAEAED